MYWPKRTDTIQYLDSFKTAIGKYDVYLYKDIWEGLLLQNGPEIWEYASMDIKTMQRLLHNGSYCPATNMRGIVPIKYGFAYKLWIKYQT